MNQHKTIVAAIQNGAHYSREIAHRTGISIPSVQARLYELVKRRIVYAHGMRGDGRRGVMPKHYRLAGN